MTRLFVITQEFDKNWNDMGLTDDDLKLLQEELIMNPQKGRLFHEKRLILYCK